MGLFSALFGQAKKQNRIISMLNNNALIIDVRTSKEFKEGHVKGSKNIPLDSISKKLDDIKSLQKPIILCCASGIRSAQATRILKRAGIEAINGGGWRSLN